MKTAYKIAFINVIIALGVGAIIWVFWPDAIANHSIGLGYEQGVGARLFLAVLITGIPALIYAVFAYVTLSHWLFRPGELNAYRARRLVESIKTTAGATKTAEQSDKHDFAD
jgi:undecaprenyl pyrophosphate phosphatase UppP